MRARVCVRACVRAFLLRVAMSLMAFLVKLTCVLQLYATCYMFFDIFVLSIEQEKNCNNNQCKLIIDLISHLRNAHTLPSILYLHKQASR